ncbi:hypothetical protein FisN_UnNu069 [Fistulifera solaris]|uniref:Uncharacterized protein n=1 Tax=Fistulifera solaris TaxID=1519565 RepID=A0A1Z5JQ75_FISSO|nr:hypothetical protein FisN_UnNu069 [Fistulifera solaris]|eukprot:GAX15918.1 hypothetical protein FisN_UnNu069 [Fistulifera solaris]
MKVIFVVSSIVLFFCCCCWERKSFTVSSALSRKVVHHRSLQSDHQKSNSNQTTSTTTTSSRSTSSTTTTVLFGTRNGYDQGGNETMCWKTMWNTSSSKEPSQKSNLIERSNEEMFTLSEESQLLPECFHDTALTVNLYHLEQQQQQQSPQLYLGRPYTIQVDLQMDFAQVTIDLFNSTLPDIWEIYFRLHLCDALQQGWCDPIRDTRQDDAALTRQEADQPLPGEEPSLEFPENADKWVYNPNVTLNGLLTKDQKKEDYNYYYYYGRWCKWKLRRQNTTTLYRTTIPITIEFPLPSKDDNYTDLYTTMGARPFLLVGQAVVPLGLTTEGEQVRLDVAQTIPSKVVYVSPPPEIAVVGNRTKIVLAVVIAIAGTFALACFVAILVYRQHAIMRLAQAPFLAVMAAACVLQIVFSFTHLPIKDGYCQWRGPLVQLPMAMVGAVLVGRVWRVYGTLSTVQRLGRSSESTTTTTKPWLDTYVVGCLDALARIPYSILSSRCRTKDTQRKGPRKSIRSAVTAAETWCLIGMLIAPQLALQIYAALHEDAQLITELNELGTAGRVVCGNVDHWITLVGTGISCCLYLLAVIMAWLSRDLPFCFNEKDPIFHAATISAIITAMSMAVAQVIDDPNTSPSAVVLLQSIVSIGIAVTVLILLVWPKIHRAWSGQTVIMSQLLSSGSSNASSNAAHSSSSETTTTASRSKDPEEGATSPTVNDTTTTWNEHEALPSHIESQIWNLQLTFRGVTEKCGNGCTLSKTEWHQLQESIQQLHTDIHQVHVE